jgi:fructose-6-phosphate aldolase 2
MQYFLDSADTAFIAKALEYYPVDGVTTNPTIIAKEHKEFRPLIQEIRRILGGDPALHLQVVATHADDMVREALAFHEIAGDNFYAKVPVTPEGLKAMKLLKSRNIRLTATAIFTPQQALMAALAGADYCAPYVDRIDNLSADGAKVVADIAQLFKIHGLNTRILAASFKSVEQVHKVCLAGAHSVTVGKDLFKKLITHPMTDVSVERFTADWEEAYGHGATTLPAAAKTV